MIKFVILACLVYLGYRLFIGPPLLSEWKSGSQLQEQEPDDEGFADFEEIE